MMLISNNFLTFADMSKFSDGIERKTKAYDREKTRREAIG